MKYLLRIVFLFHCFPCLLAQNLVQNPGFEELAGNPRNGHTTINCSKNWYSPSFAGTDYFIRVNGVGEGVPRNEEGIQAPHSGNAYAGICIHRDYVEYIATKLSQPLVAGKAYLVEFYISRAEKSFASINELGILFSEKPLKSLDMKGFALLPSIKFTNAKGFKEEKDWVKLSGVYEAKGFEAYLTLGHFIYDHPDGVRLFSHYYIDDVSISPVEEEEKWEMQGPFVEMEPDSIPPLFSPKPDEAITLKHVFFETGKSELLPASYRELDKLSQYLESDMEANISIGGHTDNLGNETKNKTLSEARAKAVAEYLISKGINSSRIQSHGFGSSKPVADNASEEARQKNRRVEFVITKD